MYSLAHKIILSYVNFIVVIMYYIVCVVHIV